MIKVMEKAGCGHRLRSWIRRLYTTATSRVTVNGFLSGSVQLQRGVRQGDPLSCALFIMLIAPLDHFINAHPDLYALAGKSGGNIKSIMYADDTILLLSAESTILAIRRCMSLYSKASNVKINLEKSVVIRVENANLDNLRIRQLGPEETVTHLDIPFTLDSLLKQEQIWPSILEKINIAGTAILRKNVSLRAKVFAIIC